MVKKEHNIKTIDSSDLVKKTDYATKINEIEKKINDNDQGKYITIQEINKLTIDNFASRLKQANLASKTDIPDFVKKTDFNKKLKITTRKSHFKIKQNLC